MSERKAEGWARRRIRDQTGRRVVITGATSGIGAAAARLLAARGAAVVLAVRNPAKAQALKDALGGRVEVREIDMRSFSSIRAFADGLQGPVDVLINNAGVMGGAFARTREGFELHFGVNHLGPFLLTSLMLGRLRDRVVAVSSHAHRVAPLDVDALNREETFDGMRSYGQSKLANLMFTFELARRLAASNAPVKAVAAHPGLTQSALLDADASTRKLRITRSLQHALGQSAAMGALPLVYAAAGDVANGAYVGPGGFYELGGFPKLVAARPHAHDADAQRALWSLSERLTGATYEGLAQRDACP